MSNEDFDTSLANQEDKELLESLQTGGKKKKTVKSDVKIEAATEVHTPAMIRIIVDEVAGVKENYEVVGVNGKVYQIKRGVPVEVPPEVVHALELAKATHSEQKYDRLADEYVEVHRSFSAIPWRVS